MALPTCAVRARVYKQDGTPDAGARITAVLTRFDVDDGYVGPIEVEVITDVDGTATLDLWPNQLGSTESAYRIRIEGAERTLSVVAVVPDEVTVDLEEIATLPVYAGKPDGQGVLEAALDALAEAQTAAANADASEAAAAASETAAAGSASAAATSETNAAASESAAAASQTAAAGSASAAATSETNAAASESAAAASETAAAGSATAAADSEATALATLPVQAVNPPAAPLANVDWIDSATGKRYTNVGTPTEPVWAEIMAAQVVDNPTLVNQLRTQLADPLVGANSLGFKLSADGAAARTQAEVNEDFVSFMDFTGADRTGVSSSSAAFAAAATFSRLTGKVVRIPSGTYKLSTSTDLSGVRFYFDPGVVIDATAVTGGNVFPVTGSEGAEIALAANATRGDTTLTVASAHGLAKGDWVLLVSQRACSHPDAGADWQLGTTTGSGSQSYFGEPLQVLEVLSATQFKTTTPLIFPSYRTDNSEETLVGGRTSSTVRKLNFATIEFLGSPLIKCPLTYAQAMWIKWAFEPRIEARFEFGDAPGGGIYSQYVLNARYKGHSDRQVDWVLTDDHSMWNTYRDVSSWYCDWDVEEHHGAQCWDQSYTGLCSILPRVRMKSFDSHEQGLTLHGNTYGAEVDAFVTNHLNSGITSRARFARIRVSSLGRADSTNSHAISLNEWGQQDARIDVTSRNNAYAVRFAKSSSSITDSPEVITADITGSIDSPTIGAFVFQTRTTQGVKPNYISIHDMKLRNVRTVVFCENTHWHGMNFRNIDLVGARDASVARLFAFGNDSAFHTFKNIRIKDSLATHVFYCPRFNDSTLASAALNRALDVDWSTIDVRDSTSDLMDGFNSNITFTTAQNVITNKLFNRPVTLDLTNTIGTRTLTLNSGYVDVMPIGSYLELVMRGTATLLVAAGAGATIYGDVESVAQGDVVKIYRTGAAAYIVNVT